MMTGGGGWEPEWVPDRALFGVEDGYLITCQGGKHLKMNKSLQTCYPQLYKELKDHFQAKDTACGVRISFITPSVSLNEDLFLQLISIDILPSTNIQRTNGWSFGTTGRSHTSYRLGLVVSTTVSEIDLLRILATTRQMELAHPLGLRRRLCHL